MKQLIILAVLALAVPAMAEDFFLYSNMQLTVGSLYNQGALHDTSRVFIASGGHVSGLNAWGFSAVDISGGSFHSLWSWDSSTVNMSSGDALGWYINANGQSTINMSSGYIHEAIYGWDSSLINISSGYVKNLNPRDSSTMNMSGGSASWSSAEDTSIANISGGSIERFYAVDSSIVNISGGSIESLHVSDTSTINIVGQNFQYGSDLILDGNRLLGTGVLSGQWSDGTPWEIDVVENYSPLQKNLWVSTGSGNAPRL